MEFYEKIKSGYFTPKSQYASKKNNPELHKMYYDEIARLEEEFRKEAIADVGLTGSKYADKVFAYAWKQGHAGGHSEVYNVLQDVAEIVKD